MYTCICTYIYIYIYSSDASRRRNASHKSSIWKNGPSPWETGAFNGHSEVNVSNGSGI